MKTIKILVWKWFFLWFQDTRGNSITQCAAAPSLWLPRQSKIGRSGGSKASHLVLNPQDLLQWGSGVESPSSCRSPFASCHPARVYIFLKLTTSIPLSSSVFCLLLSSVFSSLFSPRSRLPMVCFVQQMIIFGGGKWEKAKRKTER